MIGVRIQKEGAKRWRIIHYNFGLEDVSKPMKFTEAVEGMMRLKDYVIEKAKERKPHKVKA